MELDDLKHLPIGPKPISSYLFSHYSSCYFPFEIALVEFSNQKGRRYLEAVAGVERRELGDYLIHTNHVDGEGVMLWPEFTPMSQIIIYERIKKLKRPAIDFIHTQ
jgi:hypothetical protein